MKQKKANHQSNAKKLQFSNPAVHEDSVKPPSPEKPSQDPIKEVDKQNSQSPVDFSLKLSQSQFEDYSEYQESNIVNTSGNLFVF